MTVVPHERLQRATDNARARFSHAIHVRPLWTPASDVSDVAVEVYYERARALVLPVDGHDQAITNADARELLGCRAC